MNRRLVALTLLLWSCAAVAAQERKDASHDQATVSLSSNLLLLNVTVTGAERGYIGELRQQDFHISEDSQPQEIVYFGSQNTPFAAAILLDVSGSMEQMIRIARAAARQFADNLRDDDVFAVYAFANKVAQVQDFSSSPDLDEVVWNMKPEGSTALYDCVYQAVKDLSQRSERRRAVLILSDGADTFSRESLSSCLQAASDAAVTLYAVNLTDPSVARQIESRTAAGALRGMAEQTGGRYIDDPGGARMYQAFEEIVEELSHQYTVGYYPTPEKHDGKWHKIRVDVGKSNAVVRTRQGYRALKKN